MGTSVWLHETPSGRFVAEFFAHAVELRRREFVRYRDAEDFAHRKATKRGAIFNEVPVERRVR